jgi:ferredoxin
MTTITIAGTGLVLLARDGETITDTIHRAGLSLNEACRRGGCGLCRVQLVTGEVDFNRTVCEQALPSDQRDAGVTLACRAVPRGDITIAVPEQRLRIIVPLLTTLTSTPQPAAASEGDPPEAEVAPFVRATLRRNRRKEGEKRARTSAAAVTG